MFITRSLILTFVQLDSNSLQPPKPPLFFCELKKVVNQFFGDFFIFLFFCVSFFNELRGLMKLKKKAPQTVSIAKQFVTRYALLESLKQWPLKLMRRTFVEGFVCVCVRQ